MERSEKDWVTHNIKFHVPYLGLKIHKNFLTSVDVRPTLDLKINTKSDISLWYSMGSKLIKSNKSLFKSHILRIVHCSSLDVS